MRLGGPCPPTTCAASAAQRDEQLADAVRAVSSSLRAGMSMTQAIAYAEGESRPPLRASLEAMNRSLQLGEPFDEAFGAMVAPRRYRRCSARRRCPSAASSQRRRPPDRPRPGGRRHCENGRRPPARFERSRRRRGLSGAILGVLPVGFFAFLWLTSREQIEGAFHTPAGIAALVLGRAPRGAGVRLDPPSPGGAMSIEVAGGDRAGRCRECMRGGRRGMRGGRRCTTPSAARPVEPCRRPAHPWPGCERCPRRSGGGWGSCWRLPSSCCRGPSRSWCPSASRSASWCDACRRPARGSDTCERSMPRSRSSSTCSPRVRRPASPLRWRSRERPMGCRGPLVARTPHRHPRGRPRRPVAR